MNLVCLSLHPYTEAAPEVIGDDGEVDFKAGAKFSSHMQEKSVAASDFSKTKTMKQQREFLPVYGARDDLMHVIRENNIVVRGGGASSTRLFESTTTRFHQSFDC